MSGFLAVMQALPQIMAFVNWIIATTKELKVESDVKTNIAQVHAAFAAKSPYELKTIFNSQSKPL